MTLKLKHSVPLEEYGEWQYKNKLVNNIINVWSQSGSLQVGQKKKTKREAFVLE